MSTIAVTSAGQISLPQTVRDRYGMAPGTPIRVIETSTGVLLVPLSDEPMTEALKNELAEWQALTNSSWDDFPYQETP